MMRGLLVIISSPSGAGKTTLSRRLLKEFGSIQFSVSYTTRPMRKGETNGVDYHFVDTKTFDTMIADGEFAEWAVVHGNHYGTSRSSVEAALSGGRDVVFDVDYQGGRELRRQWPEDELSIFILPPDLKTLEQRLRSRATDADDVIRRRLAKAIEELEYHKEYRHRIINDDVDEAYGVLRAVYLIRRGLAQESAPETAPPHSHDSMQTLYDESMGKSAYAHADGLLTAEHSAD